MTTADIINHTLDIEGEEFTDDPDDPGGPTRWGCTLATLAEFRGCSVTIAQLQALTRDEAFEVFEHLYAQRSGFLHLDNGYVAAMMVDWAINGGVVTAVRHLQFALGVQVDGHCGPITLAAANAREPRALLKQLGRDRQEWYVDIVKRRPSQIKYLHGWLDRNWTMVVDTL